MRSAWGLIRALPVAGMIATLIMSPAFGDTGVHALLQCRAIRDTNDRLACFDRESAVLDDETSVTSHVVDIARATSPTEPAAKGTAPPVVTAARLTPTEKFGLPPATIVARDGEPGQPTEITEVSARVMGLALQDDGRVVFSLDNGQAWRELTPAGDLLVKLGDTVRLVRGAFGSFRIKTTTGRDCKVTRVH